MLQLNRSQAVKADQTYAALYLVGPKTWQGIENSVSQGWVTLLPKLKQQNRKKGCDLQSRGQRVGQRQKELVRQKMGLGDDLVKACLSQVLFEVWLVG